MNHVAEILRLKRDSLKERATDWLFFMGIADYMGYVIEMPETKKLIEAVGKQQSEEAESLKKSEDDTLRELGCVKEKILKKLSRKNLLNRKLKKKMKSFQVHDAGYGEVTPSIRELAFQSDSIIQDICNIGHRGIVRDFFLDFPQYYQPKYAFLGKYTFSEKIESYLQKKEEFDNNKEEKIWGICDKLISAYKVFLNGGQEIETSLKKDLKSVIGLVPYLEDMRIIKQAKEERSNRKKGMNELEREKYENYILTFHNYLIEKLHEAGSGRKIAGESDGNSPHYEYNDYGTKTGKLSMGTFSIMFKKITAQIAQYFYSLRNTGDVYKSYKDFNEFAKQSISSDDFSKKIIAINKRVEKETKKLFKEIISKGETKKQEANIYKWNKLFL